MFFLHRFRAACLVMAVSAWGCYAAIAESIEPLQMHPSSKFATMAQRNDHARRAFITRRGGRIWLQHVRKAGGTTLCHFFSAKGNVRTRSRSNRGPCWASPALTSISSRARMQQAERTADQENLELISSEDGHFPPHARQGMTDDSLANWTFISVVRHPIDHLISHAVFDLDFDLHTAQSRPSANASAALGSSAAQVDLTKLASALLSIANGTNAIKVSKGCKFDNYLTRVFASGCNLPSAAITQEHYRTAAATLASFELVFVIEWLPELLPITRYSLGMTNLASSAHNHNSKFQSYRYSNRAVVQDRAHTAANWAQGASSSLRQRLPTQLLSQLRQLLHYDFLLYDQCKRMALAKTQQWLYHDPEMQGETSELTTPSEVKSSSGRAPTAASAKSPRRRAHHPKPTNKAAHHSAWQAAEHSVPSRP